MSMGSWLAEGPVVRTRECETATVFPPYSRIRQSTMLGVLALYRWKCEMTSGEQKMLARGVAAGTILGLAIGLMIALFIAMKPALFAGLIQ